MRGIIGVLATLSAVVFAMNVAQVAAGNACDVTEEPWGNAADHCSCNNGYTDSECQLSFDNRMIACKGTFTYDVPGGTKEGRLGESYSINQLPNANKRGRR